MQNQTYLLKLIDRELKLIPLKKEIRRIQVKQREKRQREKESKNYG